MWIKRLALGQYRESGLQSRNQATCKRRGFFFFAEKMRQLRELKCMDIFDAMDSYQKIMNNSFPSACSHPTSFPPSPLAAVGPTSCSSTHPYTLSASYFPLFFTFSRHSFLDTGRLFLALIPLHFSVSTSHGPTLPLFTSSQPSVRSNHQLTK